MAVSAGASGAGVEVLGGDLGGATLPAELEGFWNGLGFALIQGYGMTETAALVTLNHPFRIGRGTIGELCRGARCGSAMRARSWCAARCWRERRGRTGVMRPREGEWLATGDLAVENESGELRFMGRKGDVIVTGAGMNVHPGGSGRGDDEAVWRARMCGGAL